MTRKSKSRRAKRPKRRFGWWSSLDRDRRRFALRSSGLACVVLVTLAGISIGLGRLEAHVNGRLLTRSHFSGLTILDLPERLEPLAREDLERSVSSLLARDWTDDRLCQEIATSLAGTGWVRHIEHVRRTGTGRFLVRARYREPVAMVQSGSEFLLVDSERVRLPGSYLFEPTWKLIQGVGGAVPLPGNRWAGEDLKAGLAIVSMLEREPFHEQITAVLVENFAGRADRRRSHIELATDRAGGRIYWGSAPGFELEENLPDQKLAILRENHRRTGRADADHAVIDISTFPDRFTIPG